jgi:hypothetical protein
MDHLSPDQRRAYADALCDLIREWVERGEGRFDVDLKRGTEWCTDARTHESLPRANPTLTLTLRINGGAEDSRGPVVLPVPPLFQPPGAP